MATKIKIKQGPVNRRLEEARKAAGFVKVSDAARALKIKPTTVYAHESGQIKRPSPEDISEYSRVYRTTAAWLLLGEGTAPHTIKTTIKPNERSERPTVPMWENGDGYLVHDPDMIPDAEPWAETVKHYLTEPGKYEVWHLIRDVIGKKAPPGSYLIVELGRKPEPGLVVLAVAKNGEPLFRFWANRALIAQPNLSLPALVEGQHASVRGVVVNAWVPRE